MLFRADQGGALTLTCTQLSNRVAEEGLLAGQALIAALGKHNIPHQVVRDLQYSTRYSASIKNLQKSQFFCFSEKGLKNINFYVLLVETQMKFEFR